jgi:hypothetical protein
MIVDRVYKYLQTDGPIPFVVRNTPGLNPSKNITNFHMSYDIKTARLSAKWTWLPCLASHTSQVAFMLPKARFPDGCDISLTCGDPNNLLVREVKFTSASSISCLSAIGYGRVLLISGDSITIAMSMEFSLRCSKNGNILLDGLPVSMIDFDTLSVTPC